MLGLRLLYLCNLAVLFTGLEDGLMVYKSILLNIYLFLSHLLDLHRTFFKFFGLFL